MPLGLTLREKQQGRPCGISVVRGIIHMAFIQNWTVDGVGACYLVLFCLLGEGVRCLGSG